MLVIGVLGPRRERNACVPLSTRLKCGSCDDCVKNVAMDAAFFFFFSVRRIVLKSRPRAGSLESISICRWPGPCLRRLSSAS